MGKFKYVIGGVSIIAVIVVSIFLAKNLMKYGSKPQAMIASNIEINDPIKFAKDYPVCKSLNGGLEQYLLSKFSESKFKVINDNESYSDIVLSGKINESVILAAKRDVAAITQGYALAPQAMMSNKNVSLEMFFYVDKKKMLLSAEAEIVLNGEKKSALKGDDLLNAVCNSEKKTMLTTLLRKDDSNFDIFGHDLIKTVSGEDAEIITMYFPDEGRNAMNQSALLAPSTGKAKELGYDAVENVLDINGDNISEVVVSSYSSGMGTSHGNVALINFDVSPSGVKEIFVKDNAEYGENSGFCSEDCLSTDIEWRIGSYMNKAALVEITTIQKGSEEEKLPPIISCQLYSYNQGKFVLNMKEKVSDCASFGEQVFNSSPPQISSNSDSLSAMLLASAKELKANSSALCDFIESGKSYEQLGRKNGVQFNSTFNVVTSKREVFFENAYGEEKNMIPILEGLEINARNGRLYIGEIPFYGKIRNAQDLLYLSDLYYWYSIPLYNKYLDKDNLDKLHIEKDIESFHQHCNSYLYKIDKEWDEQWDFSKEKNPSFRRYVRLLGRLD